MLRVYGAKASSERIEGDEYAFDATHPWAMAGDGLMVVFHLDAQRSAEGWTCWACGTSSAPWSHA